MLVNSELILVQSFCVPPWTLQFFSSFSLFGIIVARTEIGYWETYRRKMSLGSGYSEEHRRTEMQHEII